MKQVYFDMKYADLQNRIAINKQAEESYRRKGEVMKAQGCYKLVQKLEKELSDLISRNTEVTVLEDTVVMFNE